ncbi:MAG: outer membrane beta-barrel protein [Candidatus Brocadiaceae bacterium]|nr:outer membrane beta-barrel protein [Candidatus Brocadiaceae bacterium]
MPIRGLKSFTRLTYLANILEYRDNPDESTVNHFIDGAFTTAFPRGLKLELIDTYIQTQEPPLIDDVLGESFRRRERKTNDFRVSITTPRYFSRFESKVFYSHYDITYEGIESASYTEQTIGEELSYELFPKVNTLFQIDVGKTKYDDGSQDGTFYEFLLGMKFQETAKTTGEFKTGYRIREYEDDDFDTFKGLVLSLNSRTQLTALSAVSVSLRRSQEESVFTEGRNYYELNALSVSYERKITSKIQAKLTNYYQLLNFPSQEQDEDEIDEFVWGIRASLHYTIKPWLFSDVNYWTEDRDVSPEDSGRFGRKKNVVTFTMGMSF